MSLLRPIAGLAALLLLGGCSAEWYRRDADRDVYRLLAEREPETLGYAPDVVAGPEQEAANLDVPGKAYYRVPETRIAPKAVAALEPMSDDLPYRPLGPAIPDRVLPGEAFLLQLQQAPLRRVEQLRLGPATPGELYVARFGLYDSLRYAVENNRDYRGRMEDLYLAALDVTFQRHLFDPIAFAGASANVNRRGSDSNYNSALNATANLGVRQQLPFGGQVVAEGIVNFVDALDGNVQDGESADLVLRGSMPLLRGFGFTNLEPLIQSERSLVYNIRGFERFRRGFSVSVAQRYFSLLTSQSRITNRYLRYISALQLVERTLFLYEAGSVPYTEVQRAQSQALRAEDSLNQAEQSYSAALDQFKIFLGMDVETPFDVIATRLDVPEPDLGDPKLLETALNLRLDLQTTRDRIEDAKRSVAINRNRLLPDVTLTARGELGSDDNDVLRFTGDDANMAAGISIDVPLDQVSERNSLRRSLISLERALRSLDESEDAIIADVRSSIRNVETAQTTLRIQREGIDIARQRLELANQRLLLNIENNSRNVVEAQNDLLEAQDAFEQAEAAYQVAVLNFYLSSGQLRVDPEAGTLGMAMHRNDPLGIDANGQSIDN